MSNVESIVSEEIEGNFFRVSNVLGELRRVLPNAIREYVEKVSKVDGVIGIYFGLDGLEIDLLDVIEADEIWTLEHPAHDFILETEREMVNRYNLGYINHRTAGSARKTLEELEEGGHIFGFFMDDNYSGKNVKRVYPLSYG